MIMERRVQAAYSTQLINYILGLFLCLLGSMAHAQENLSAPLLSPEDAFAFSVESTKKNEAR